MPRKRAVVKREVLPDPKFGDRTVAKFVNGLMSSGKKSTAESILYGAMQIVAEKTKDDPLKIFRTALDNVRPVVEVKSRRVGGSTYQIPVEIRSERRTALGMRWLISYAAARGEKSMTERLAAEILDAANMRGASIKKKEDTHKMAEANKAFSHYRW
ncbi:30S ribosomal protein S7 [bacterium]|nr:30S ribosomal protein S7 [bacterium]